MISRDATPSDGSGASGVVFVRSWSTRPELALELLDLAPQRARPRPEKAGRRGHGHRCAATISATRARTAARAGPGRAPRRG